MKDVGVAVLRVASVMTGMRRQGVLCNRSEVKLEQVTSTVALRTR